MIRLLFRLWASLMMPILPEIFLSEKSSSSDKPRFVQCTNVNISFTVSVVPSIRGPPGKNKAYIFTKNAPSGRFVLAILREYFFMHFTNFIHKKSYFVYATL